jgi:hypothetical protein
MPEHAEKGRNGNVRLAAAIVIIAAVLVVAIAAVFLVRATRVDVVRVSLRVDDAARNRLIAAISAFDEGNRSVSVSVLPPGEAAEADLVLDSAQSGGIPWRTIGWRIWTRLETAAGIEGRLSRPIIRPMREAALTDREFEFVLESARKSGIVPIVVPAQAPAYGKALDKWIELSGIARGGLVDWSAKGYIARLASLRDALDRLARGKALFMIGPDSIGELISPSRDNHPEGFPLPGSRSGSDSWAIGRTESFSLSPDAKKGVAGAAADLVTYLTSKGMSRDFAGKLPGEFHIWKVAPNKGELPRVSGPARSVDPES